MRNLLAEFLCGFSLRTLIFLLDMIFFWSAPVAFRRVALETPEWTSRDSNHHRQSVSAGKTNAIPTEPSGRLRKKIVVRRPRSSQATLKP